MKFRWINGAVRSMYLFQEGILAGDQEKLKMTNKIERVMQKRSLPFDIIMESMDMHEQAKFEFKEMDKKEDKKGKLKIKSVL